MEDDPSIKTLSIPYASRREWIGLAVIALPCLLYSLDLTVLSLAVPALSADLEPSAGQLLWILDIYGFVSASMLVTMGSLGDRIGRRRLLLFGAAAFGAASILAAFSTSATTLIAARATLGLAGATLAPTTLSLVRHMFHDARERAFAIGVWISSHSIGAAIGPLVGGFLLEYFRWGSVFLVAVPVMVLVLVLGPLLIPEYREPHAKPIDLPSSVLSLVAVLVTTFGLKRAAEHGFAWSSLACVVAGLGIAWLFFQRQSRLLVPMLDRRLICSRAFRAPLAAYTLVSFVAVGSSVFVAQYLQLVLGLNPLQAGLWTLPIPAAYIVGATITPHLAQRVRPVSLITAGLAIATAGLVVLSRVNEDTTPAALAAICCTYALGLAPAFTLTIHILLSGAAPENAGTVSAISETGSEFGGALGIALLGSIFTAVYRTEMSDSGFLSASADAAAATLSAAAGAMHVISSPISADLLEASQKAFVQGLHAVALVSTAIIAVTAIFAAHSMRLAKLE